MLITFLKVFQGLLLKVFEEIQPESLLQTVAVVSEEALQSIPAGGEQILKLFINTAKTLAAFFKNRKY